MTSAKVFETEKTTLVCTNKISNALQFGLCILVFFATFLASPVFAQESAFAVKLTLQPAQIGAAANRSILGNNIQWVDNADGLLVRDTLEFAPNVVSLTKAMGTSILRYPGGSHSDVYHWRDGVGEHARRGHNEHFFTKAKQKISFGTQEFLEFCEAVNAVPLLTVNTATGTPQEAADWVNYVNNTRLKSNKTGKLLPKVRYWEIGNEPYVNDEQRKELWVKPHVFAAKANLFIRAMKKVDPTIEIGVPLRSDKVGTVPATPHQGYNAKLLSDIDAPFEFVALHNAYLPFNYDSSKQYSKEDYYWATMAASRVVTEDFNVTRNLLRQFKPGKNIPLAVTEFNALYMISERSEAGYISSLAGALYVADILRLFATTPDLQFANFWSLSGNWHFGILGDINQPRPAFHVLKMFNTVLRGNLIGLDVTSPTFANNSVGVVPAYKDTPTVTGMATKDGAIIQLLLINKDLTKSGNAMLSIASNPKIAEMSYSRITGANAFASGTAAAVMTEQTGSVTTGSFPITLTLPPRSVSVFSIKLKP